VSLKPDLPEIHTSIKQNLGVQTASHANIREPGSGLRTVHESGHAHEGDLTSVTHPILDQR